MAVLDVEKLIAETNKQLQRQQHIHPDDPILASVILHNQILQAQVDAINKKLEEIMHQLTVASEQQIENAKLITNSIISEGGNKIEKQLEAVIQNGENRLKQAEEKAKFNIDWSSNIALFASIAITIVVCAFIGVWGANFFYGFLFHVKH